MNIESLLKPAKYTDEQILRYYSKLTKKWENKGHSRYSLAHAFNFSSIPPIVWVVSNLPFGDYANFFNHFLSWNFAFDNVRNFREPSIKEDISDGIKTKTNSPVLSFYENFTNFSRLPLFLTGLGLIGGGAYEIVDYFKTGNNESLNSAFFDLCFGYSSFGVSSSIYVKDSNPKLLDKAPFWKTAYDWTKEKVKSLVPSPQPSQHPSPAFSMENYLPVN